MTDETLLIQNTSKAVDAKNTALEELIRLNGGFLGAKFDRDTVKLMEDKLKEQNKHIPILCMVILGINGGELFAVAEDRVADVRSFASKEALCKYMGKIEIGELECITLVRRKGDPPRLAVDASVQLEQGKPCVEYGGMVITGN